MGRKKRKVKFYALAMAVAMLFTGTGNVIYVAEAATYETDNLDDMYRKYDLETGEVTLVPRYSVPSYSRGERVTCTEPYIPAEVTQQENIGRALIGVYERTPVTNTSTYPYRAIAQLEMVYADGTTGQGTGFMVSSNVMLTAGHCCMSRNNAAVNSITVNLGRNGDSVVKVTTVSSYYVCANYNYFGDSVQDDYAILVLSEDVGDITGWFGLGYSTNSFFYNNEFAITGYPGDKTYGTMWKATGDIENCTTYELHYYMDMYPGQSGSPIYTNSYVAYGINVAETSTMNYGRRMTQEVFDWLLDQGFIS